MKRRVRWGVLWMALVGGLGGCVVAGGFGRAPGGAPFHLTTLAQEGDAARRASMRLVLEALDADAAARPETASELYERALQVDPTNPWAYLALARHRVESVRPEEAFAVLDQAEALLRSGDGLSPQVEAHLAGLRGAALLARGQREEGLVRLRHARELSPTVWSDGHLDPWELR